MDAKTGYPSVDKPWMKYYSQGLDKEPYKGGVYSHIWEKNKDYLNNVAITYFGKNITYAELFNKVDEVARALSAYGVKKGDNVALLMLSCPELVYLILALNKLGAVANMINPLFDENQIRDRINDTEASLIVVLDQLFGRLEKIQKSLCVQDIVVVQIERSMPTVTRLIAHHKLKKNIEYIGAVCKWDDFIFKYSAENKIVECCEDESAPALMVYSSGTTGASKGIVLMNKGINATVAHYENTGFVYERSYSYLQIIPTWFSTGIVFCLIMPLCLGVSVIIEPVFSEENFAKDILKYKPNMIMAPTSLWLYAIKEIDKKKKNMSFIKYPITGGEKLLSDTENMLNDILKKNGCKTHFVTGYGMCELGSTATSTSVEFTKPGTAGYPILGVVASAFNIDTNSECKYNERGEIRVLTPSRMKEYYKRPDATAEFFWKDSDGNEWGCTGDVGYVDEDGFVFVQGRASDYFTNRAGEKVYCFDIEDVILDMKQVYQCEVIGVSSEQGYDISVAFVVLDAGVSDDRESVRRQIEEHCKENISEDIRPVATYILDKFPVKSSGKRDMEKLHEMAVEALAQEK